MCCASVPASPHSTVPQRRSLPCSCSTHPTQQSIKPGPPPALCCACESWATVHTHRWDRLSDLVASTSLLRFAARRIPFLSRLRAPRLAPSSLISLSCPPRAEPFRRIVAPPSVCDGSCLPQHPRQAPTCLLRWPVTSGTVAVATPRLQCSPRQHQGRPTARATARRTSSQNSGAQGQASPRSRRDATIASQSIQASLAQLNCHASQASQPLLIRFGPFIT